MTTAEERDAPGPSPASWTVPPEAAGERLDRHVAAHLDIPRNQVQAWIRDGRVEVGGRPAPRPSMEVAAGAEIRCTPPAPHDDRVQPEEGPLAVLYEDADLAVLDKPPGLTVHPGAGQPTGTLAHRLLARYPEIVGVGGPGRPGIVHRLDRDTSGALVIARTPAVYRALSRAFAARQVAKTYLAIAYGAPTPPVGLIDAPIGRHPQRRQEMTIRPGGRPARTHYRTLAAANGIALLELGLETGRTHQIRVHLKSLNHPLVGDPVYGEARWKALPRQRQTILRDFPRPALHAWRLRFRHPATGTEVACEAPVPADLRALWQEAVGSAFPELPEGSPRP